MEIGIISVQANGRCAVLPLEAGKKTAQKNGNTTVKNCHKWSHEIYVTRKSGLKETIQRKIKNTWQWRTNNININLCYTIALPLKSCQKLKNQIMHP